MTASRRSASRVAASIERLHDEATAFFTRLDGGGTVPGGPVGPRPEGGGGVTRVLADGRTFEKAGVNRSVVDGDAAGRRWRSGSGPEPAAGADAAVLRDRA